MLIKKILVAFGLGALVIGAIALMWYSEQQDRHVIVSANGEPVAQPTREPKPAIPIPAYQHDVVLAELPKTLAPEIFNGYARTAYAIAQEIPDTLAQLPCYCHCDRSQGHKSLHSCFVDYHGSTCGICMNEAMTAYKLKKEKKMSIDKIRERIIAEYSKQY